ncbi:MAG: DUF1634 domain-containing protein [Thaumarchaeota archaeon]|nr:DUF1634 domain-containing protein [Nitrososphaerota archaeon]MCL5318083.1 DUF1634 domain-containing protein [Nitrososphaerota archaeon]
MGGEIKKSGGRMETTLSLVLRWGVILSGIVIFLGVVLMLLTGRSGYGAGADIEKILQYNESNVPHRFYPTDIQTILTGLLTLKPFAIIDFGLIMLIATPIMRIVTAIILFGIERDRKYVVITSIVLAIIILGILTS